MSEQARYSAQKKKLEGLCDAHKLTFRLEHDDYPIRLIIRPLQGMYDQLSMLEAAEDGEGRISADASLTFVKKDGDISIRSFGAFAISEALQTKLKNVFKKICENWEGYFFRSIMETRAVKSGLMPVIDEGEDDEQPNEEPGEDDPEPQETGCNPDDITEEMIEAAIATVRFENKCTWSLLMRKMKINSAQAIMLIDAMEQRGVVGAFSSEISGHPVLPAAEPEDDPE